MVMGRVDWGLVSSTTMLVASSMTQRHILQRFGQITSGAVASGD